MVLVPHLDLAEKYKQYVNQSMFAHVSLSPRMYKQESPADAGIPARRKNDEKNSSISKL